MFIIKEFKIWIKFNVMIIASCFREREREREHEREKKREK